MSIGSTLYYDKYALKDILDKIRKQGIIVVAALSNEYKISYPASLPGVIGVKYCYNLGERDIQFNSNPIDGIELSIGCKQRIFDRDIVQCNSYAAAAISGIILKTFNTLDTDTVLAYFQKKSTISYCIDECLKHGNIYDIPCVRYTDVYFPDCRNLTTGLNEKFFNYGYHSIIVTQSYQNLYEDIFAISNGKGTILEQINNLIYISTPDIVLINSDIMMDCSCIDFDVIIERNGIRIFNADFQHWFELPKTNITDFVVDKILKCYSTIKS